MSGATARSELEVGVRAALGKKARDLSVLDIRKVSSLADYFVICHGTSDRQVATIAEAIEAELKGGGRRPTSVEGLPRAEWVLLDYGDMVFHVFLEERRRYYALERLWGDALDITDEIEMEEAAREGEGG